MIVCDEVHNAGAAAWRKGLLIEYDARLGLSATVERNFDDEGTEVIKNYFENEIKSNFTLNDAIYKKKILNKFEYHIEESYLNKEEEDKYNELSRRIAQLSNKENKRIDEELEKILLKRRDIVKNCEEKFIAFEKILKKINKNNLLIFCHHKQLKQVNKILRKYSLHYNNFVTKSEFNQMGFKNAKERHEMRLNFINGFVPILIGINILNEGINLKNADKMIILSSDNNKKDFIQRRGRILRISKDKDISKIYDIVVRSLNEKIDKSLLKNEIKRIEIYSDSCDNKKYINQTLKKYYGLRDN